MNNLYAPSEGENADYDLLASLEEAVMSIPENLMGLSYSDPLGIEVGDLTDSAAVAEEQEVSSSIFGNLKQHFVTGNAAFAYLIFILLYTPCVAAMGAYVREFGDKYARFIAIWTMGLAYGSATIFYQVTHLTLHPVTSTAWIVGILLVFYASYRTLKSVGNKQLALEAQVA